MISAKGLTKYYGEKCAIRDLSFEIASGEIVGILGLNGAGKTTTLRVLSCLLLPSSGSVRIGGLDVVENPHGVRKLVGFLPETPPLYGEMSVESFLLFAGQLRGLGPKRAKERLEETLETIEITDVRREVIADLSHGYRQRVGIAQAVIHDPPLVILDEPIQGLDPVQIVHMRELVRSLRAKHTILLSSHILSEISQTCDRILMLQQGELVAVGTEQQLKQELTGANRLHVVVRGDQEAVLAAVRAIEHVTDCTGGPAPGGDSVQLKVTGDEDVREQVSRTLVQSGFGLLQLTPATGDLESVFLQLAHSGAVADASDSDDDSTGDASRTPRSAAAMSALQEADAPAEAPAQPGEES